MATLISKKYKGKAKWYIVENNKENGKLDRVYLDTLGIMTKTEAKTKLANYIALNKNKGAAKITIKQAAQEFSIHYKNLIGQNIKPRTFELFEYAYNHITDLLGHVEISKISFENIESFKMELQKTELSNRVINMHLTELKKILDYAVNRHWINEYPQIKRASEAKQDKEVDALSREEIEKLLESANEKQALYLCLMIYTGMRPSEAVNLTWDNVNLEKNQISILSDNRFKTGRPLPLHSKLKPILINIEPKTGELSPFRESSYARKSMERLERLTGIKCNPYKLRKTFGSILAAEGADSIYVAKLMGHAKLQTTYQYYLRLSDDNLKNAIEKM